MKVLVADDDAITRRMVEGVLRRWGYDVVVAEDGDQAWASLQGDDAPQMAILDWQMPGLDGVEVCRRLRAQTGRPYVYVVVLTSRDTSQDLAQGAEAGADDYLVKPFDPPRLKMRVRAGLRILQLQAELMKSVENYKRADAELEQARVREVETGARIQQTLLLGQPPPGLFGARIAAITSPSQMIDGDFYDFFVHNESCFDVIVGDVMGKGIPGALIGAAVKSHLQRALSQLIYSDRGSLPEPEDIIAVVHSDVTKELIKLETFATLCYARFDRAKMKLTLVDCGHTATIHWQPSKDATRLLQGDNVPLGFIETETYKQIEQSFEPGDLFFFYSDGVTEAMSSTGEMFGVDRLRELIRRGGLIEPHKLIERVRAAVVAFTQSETFADDLTCVAVKMDEVPWGAPLVHAEIIVTSELNQLQKIRSFVSEAVERGEGAELDDEAHYQLLLAVNEAASNIVRHAHGGRSGETIVVSSDLFTDRIVIRLSHHGQPFDPATAKPPSFDGTREGGFGVYMIEQCVDEVQYLSEADGKNTIRLVKRESTR
ncbi:MAG: SpoIIE family protein phosphatase [Capsulimonadaceae bacterium]|nr:SpoIIE family protein phosphatase [Capsulimonadaceae bacterium]